MSADFQPGTIVVRTNERRLYYVLGRGEAIRYPVGVGRAGMQWSGTTYINGKYSHARLVAAGDRPARQTGPAGRDSRRLAA